MTENLQKEEVRSPLEAVESVDSLPKKPRTSEDFYLFCKFILEYENYDLAKKEEEEYAMDVTSEKTTAEPSLKDTEESNSVVGMTTEDSFDLVTCFCRKPFAGRPMIECSSCFTWIHLRCVKIKKSEIPDIFICPACKKRQH